MKKWQNYFVFKICLLAAKEVIFFLITTKRCARRISLSKLESNLKNKSPNYKKVKKLMSEVLFFVHYFFSKMYVQATGGEFLLIDAIRKVFKNFKKKI